MSDELKPCPFCGSRAQYSNIALDSAPDHYVECVCGARGGYNKDKATAIDTWNARSVEAERKRDCVAFFQWWWNRPGSNTEEGYDQWVEQE